MLYTSQCTYEGVWIGNLYLCWETGSALFVFTSKFQWKFHKDKWWTRLEQIADDTRYCVLSQLYLSKLASVNQFNSFSKVQPIYRSILAIFRYIVAGIYNSQWMKITKVNLRPHWKQFCSSHIPLKLTAYLCDPVMYFHNEQRPSRSLAKLLAWKVH